jgi:CubicO group peptidase (beta-lactamase class C family)
MHRLPKWLRVTAAALGVLLAASALTYLWALGATDQSGLARAIAWQGADADDWQRFPSRPIAPAAEPFWFKTGVWPGLESISVPTDHGVARRDLNQFMTETGTSAFIVLRGDELLTERYYNGASRDSVMTSFSMAKSFLSALVAIAIAEGRIGSVDDPITKYVPELAKRDPAFARITLRDLLSMSSGLKYSELGLPWSDDSLTYYDPDLRRLALQGTQVDGPPGQAFLYNNYNPLLVGLALERATGQTAASYLEQHLWQPMGAEYGASWSLDSKSDGFEKMESGINARAIDFAKFGLLYLRHGRWGDQRLIPGDWVGESTTPQAAPGSPSGTRYGYFWWIHSGDATPPAASRLFARGNLGQFIFVAPDANLVVVRLGREFGYEHWNELLDRLATDIATARSSSPASHVRTP